MAASQRKKTIPDVPGEAQNIQDSTVQFNRTLKFGATGDDVKALQEALAEAGCKVEATGVYDMATVRAVQVMQLKQKLPANGIASKAEIPVLLS